MIMVIWTYTGYTLVLYMAGIQGISKDLYEAADIDGASKLRQFFSITVPMLKPTSFLIAVTLVISTFQVFLRRIRHDEGRTAQFHHGAVLLHLHSSVPIL